MKNPLLLALMLSASLAGVPSAWAQSTPGDAAVPVVELMPLIMKQEKELQLSPEQVQAFADYRTGAAPTRMALQKEIVSLRGQLRAALLEGASPEVSAALMQKIAAAEVEHFKGRERCVEFTRKVLSPEQFATLKRNYLESLPPMK